MFQNLRAPASKKRVARSKRAIIKSKSIIYLLYSLRVNLAIFSTCLYPAVKESEAYSFLQSQYIGDSDFVASIRACSCSGVPSTPEAVTIPDGAIATPQGVALI